MNESENNFNEFDNETYELVKRFEQMNPQNAENLFDEDELIEIISFYLDYDKNDEASVVISYAQHLYPQNLYLFHLQIRNLMELKHYDTAHTILLKREKTEPDNGDLKLMLGYLHSTTDDLKKAKQKFDEALHLDVEEKAEVLYQIGILFKNKERYDLSKKYLQQSHKLDPESQNTIFYLAYAYERLSENKRSEEFYYKYLENNQLDEIAWYNLGHVYVKQADEKQALECFEKAVTIDPQFNLAYLSRCRSLINLEEYLPAIEYLSDYLEKKPNSVEALYDLAHCHYKLDNYETARTIYNEILSRDDELPHIWLALAMTYSDVKKFRSATRFLKKALQYDEENSGYWNILAQVYYKRHHFRKAKKAVNKSLFYDKQNIAAWMNKSRMAVFPKWVVRVLTEACKHNPQNAHILYKMAAYKLIDGQFDSGLSDLKQALELDFSARDDFFYYYGRNFTELNEFVENFNKKN